PEAASVSYGECLFLCRCEGSFLSTQVERDSFLVDDDPLGSAIALDSLCCLGTDRGIDAFEPCLTSVCIEVFCFDDDFDCRSLPGVHLVRVGVNAGTDEFDESVYVFLPGSARIFIQAFIGISRTLHASFLVLCDSRIAGV